MLNHSQNVFAILIVEIIIGEINALNIYPFYFFHFLPQKHSMYTIGVYV